MNNTEISFDIDLSYDKSVPCQGLRGSCSVEKSICGQAKIDANTITLSKITETYDPIFKNNKETTQIQLSDILPNLLQINELVKRIELLEKKVQEYEKR